VTDSPAPTVDPSAVVIDIGPESVPVAAAAPTLVPGAFVLGVDTIAIPVVVYDTAVVMAGVVVIDGALSSGSGTEGDLSGYLVTAAITIDTVDGVQTSSRIDSITTTDNVE